MRAPPNGQIVGAMPDARSGSKEVSTCLPAMVQLDAALVQLDARAGVLACITAIAALLLTVSALAGPGAGAQVRLRAALPPP